MGTMDERYQLWIWSDILWVCMHVKLTVLNQGNRKMRIGKHLQYFWEGNKMDFT